jgi:poly(3-hydroxybutyrate) depolymerase
MTRGGQTQLLGNVFVTDWRSASPEMRFFSIDSHFADLNVVVDELGGCVNLIGICQGGWMALVYAARYPSKIHGLVLAGAPVDINAGESELSRIAHRVPASVFNQLVELGDGRRPRRASAAALETSTARPRGNSWPVAGSG